MKLSDVICELEKYDDITKKPFFKSLFNDPEEIRRLKEIVSYNQRHKNKDCVLAHEKTLEIIELLFKIDTNLNQKEFIFPDTSLFKYFDAKSLITKEFNAEKYQEVKDIRANRLAASVQSFKSMGNS